VCGGGQWGGIGYGWGEGVTWWSTTVLEPAQKPPEEQRLFATEPIRMSTLEAWGRDGMGEWGLGGAGWTYGDVVEFG